MNSSLILLLHAHLPYVRHPEHHYSLEENWLFEAIRETYVPLLDVLSDMVSDGISPQLTLSLSPTLLEMLNDELLRDRFVRYLDNLIELSEAEKSRTKKTPFEPMAFLYNKKFKQTRQSYLSTYNRDIVSAFRSLQDDGHIEIITTAATHAFLPAYEGFPEAIRRQIEVGVECYRRNFGRKPAGLWLPECGYFNGLEHLLRASGIRYFFLESHGILNAKPLPKCGIYRPVALPNGLVAFGRDFKSSRQVWCASSGYPGDYSYRDFYRDIGFDLPSDYIDRYTRLDGIRTFTGMKYHSVTDKGDNKVPYNRTMAMKKVADHVVHFINSRVADFESLSCSGPVIFSAFDAELFGHWWFEGIEWLESLLRNISEGKLSFRMVTPSEFLVSCPSEKYDVVLPSPSSWGEGGYNSLWIGDRNHHIYRHLHKMEDMINSMQKKLSDLDMTRDTIMGRVFNQALREVLLAQASDWAFLIQRGSASEYAESRIKAHMERTSLLYSMLMNNRVDHEVLAQIEGLDRIFPWLE